MYVADEPTVFLTDLAPNFYDYIAPVFLFYFTRLCMCVFEFIRTLHYFFNSS